MTFKEAMEHYRAGVASEEERQLVEQELEKNRLIAEYLDEAWEGSVAVQPAPAEEMQQVRKTLRRRNALIVLTSLVLAAALCLGIVYVGIPAAESLYWDPTVTSFDTPWTTDLELMLAAYDELICPETDIVMVGAGKKGFAAYDVLVQYGDTYRGGDVNFAMGSVEKGVLTLPAGLLRTCPVNIFDRATYPFYEMTSEVEENTYGKLSELPGYVTVVAAVSFPEDKSMAEILEFQESLLDGIVGWTAIRTAPLEEQVLPLCGMDIFPYGKVRAEINDDYPCFDIKGADLTAQTLETHFKSLLRFSADMKETKEYAQDHWNLHFTGWLDYVEENGIYSYGCYVVGTPETFLALLDSGAASQVWIQDIWISP